MGVVHLAATPDGRRVALKVLRPHVVGDDEARERLAREVASLRKVSSRHVAEILDADPWGETPYIVTRYVPGHALFESVRRDGPLGLDDLEHTGRRLLEAVRDVHAADVLHRDLKPTNVVMEGRSPILIDFGLARLAEDPRLTATGWLLGTPGYLAPEVLFGDDATPATDVHGWAATLAYAATGESPYGRGHTMAILDRTRRGEVDLRAVPAPLRPLLAACLSTEPLDRPSTAEALAALDDLESADLPTSRLAAAPRTAPAPADPTLPWQLARPDEPATEVMAAVPPAAPATPATPPTLIAPRPPAAQAWTSPPPPSGHQAPAQPVIQAVPRLDAPVKTGGERALRSVLLLGLLAVTVSVFCLAPYLTLATAAVVVLVVRGLHRSHEAARQRRAQRGPRWFDVPLDVLGYPWHVLRTSAGTVALVGVAALFAAVASSVAFVLGLSAGDALLVGGVVLAPMLWWGPGADRFRPPVARVASAAARDATVAWSLGAGLALASAGAWLLLRQHGVVWAPAAGAPWGVLRDLVPGLRP